MLFSDVLYMLVRYVYESSRSYVLDVDFIRHCGVVVFAMFS